MSDFIPVIDLAPARSGSLEQRRAVAEAIGRACERSGFLVITGHGVDPGLVEAMYATTGAFFRLPEEAKSQVRAGTTLRGWRREGGYVAASSGFETPPDLCELFTYNRLGDPGVAERSGLGDAIDTMSGPNQWPEALPELEATWIGYYRVMESLALDLMHLFAIALDLPEDWFDDKLDHHMTNLTANWYYALSGPPLTGQYRKGPHSDWGSLTILYQDDVGGLQVQAPRPDGAGDWVDVPFVAGSYVINIGDLMARWTNDRWVSTMHRVVVPPTERYGIGRISIAFFHQPNYDALIECLPSCLTGSTAMAPPAVTSGEWLTRKLQAAYGGVALQD